MSVRGAGLSGRSCGTRLASYSIDPGFGAFGAGAASAAVAGDVVGRPSAGRSVGAALAEAAQDALEAACHRAGDG